MDDLQRNKTRVFWTRSWLTSVHYKAVSEKNAGAKQQKVVKRRVNASFYMLHASDPPCIVAWLLPPGPSFFPKLFIHQTDSGPLTRLPLKLGVQRRGGKQQSRGFLSRLLTIYFSSRRCKLGQYELSLCQVPPVSPVLFTTSTCNRCGDQIHHSEK